MMFPSSSIPKSSADFKSSLPRKRISRAGSDLQSFSVNAAMNGIRHSFPFLTSISFVAMFQSRRAANVCLAAAITSFALSIVLFSIDFRPGCSCNDWEVCCAKNVDICGEERCLCQDVLLYNEEEEEETSYCANQTVIPLLSPAFWIGYVCCIAFVILLKLGIVLHIVAWCQDLQARPVYIVQGVPLSKMPGQKTRETDSLVV